MANKLSRAERTKRNMAQRKSNKLNSKRSVPQSSVSVSEKPPSKPVKQGQQSGLFRSRRGFLNMSIMNLPPISQWANTWKPHHHANALLAAGALGASLISGVIVPFVFGTPSGSKAPSSKVNASIKATVTARSNNSLARDRLSRPIKQDVIYENTVQQAFKLEAGVDESSQTQFGLSDNVINKYQTIEVLPKNNKLKNAAPVWQTASAVFHDVEANMKGSSSRSETWKACVYVLTCRRKAGHMDAGNLIDALNKDKRFRGKETLFSPKAASATFFARLSALNPS